MPHDTIVRDVRFGRDAARMVTTSADPHAACPSIKSGCTGVGHRQRRTAWGTAYSTKAASKMQFELRTAPKSSRSATPTTNPSGCGTRRRVGHWETDASTRLKWASPVSTLTGRKSLLPAIPMSSCGMLRQERRLANLRMNSFSYTMPVSVPTAQRSSPQAAGFNCGTL